MTRYVIIGAGAVGITLAAELQASGRDVVVVGRGRQLDLLRAGAVRYLPPGGSRLLSVAAAGRPDEVRLDSRDILVLATKSQDAHGVLALWSRQPVGTGGQRAGEVLPVFTLQNGLDAERAALRLFSTVVGSVLGVPSTYVADGEVLSPGAPATGVFWLGSYPDGPAGAAAQTIAADLSAARFEVQVVPDLSRWKAAKLVISSTFVLDALFEPGPGRDRAARLVQAEARAVLEAAGWSIADTAAESTLRLDRFGIAPVPGHARPGSSTYQSLGSLSTAPSCSKAPAAGSKPASPSRSRPVIITSSYWLSMTWTLTTTCGRWSSTAANISTCRDWHRNTQDRVRSPTTSTSTACRLPAPSCRGSSGGLGDAEKVGDNFLDQILPGVAA